MPGWRRTGHKPAAVLGHIDCIRSTPGAFVSGVGGIGQRVGWDDAGDGAAMQTESDNTYAASESNKCKARKEIILDSRPVTLKLS